MQSICQPPEGSDTDGCNFNQFSSTTQYSTIYFKSVHSLAAVNRNMVNYVSGTDKEDSVNTETLMSHWPAT